MDGLKRAVKKQSLQKKLNSWIMLASVIFALLASVVLGVLSFIEAQGSQDIHLRQIGELVAQGQLSSGIATGGDTDETLLIQRLQVGFQGKLPIAFNHPDGLYSLILQGEQWRVLILTSPETNHTPSMHFAVAQQTAFRDELAWESSLYSFFAILLLVPLLMGVIHMIIHRSFMPLQVLSEQVGQLKEANLVPLEEAGVPQEITPFIVSINHLLLRIRDMFTQQNRFISDAAHELRTPLTALSLLTENLTNAVDMKQVEQRLRPLQEGMSRMQALVKQLLSLARIQGNPTKEMEVVNIQTIVQYAMADLYPLAEAKSIDLGMLQNKSMMLMDIEGGLAILLRNAIDNAIRYTPYGGKVDVSLFVKDTYAVLQVHDSGPGILENKLTQVFEPFYRMQGNAESGNGLGLAISLEISHRLGGEITLSNHPSGGLLFDYRQLLVEPDK